MDEAGGASETQGIKEKIVKMTEIREILGVGGRIIKWN